MNNSNEHEVQIDITNEVEDGVYSNMALITHSSAEFILDFIRILPNRPKPKVASRVVMSPEHTKRFFLALRDNLTNYEKTFGEIKLPSNAPRTATPFGNPKGEA